MSASVTTVTLTDRKQNISTLMSEIQIRKLIWGVDLFIYNFPSIKA